MIPNFLFESSGLFFEVIIGLLPSKFQQIRWQ